MYASKGGNTKKIAQEISAELACETLQVDGKAASLSLDGYDLVFVGTGICGGNPNPDLQRCLQAAPIQPDQTFALFLTWGGAGKTNQLVFVKLKSILEGKGAKVLGDTFACYGGWKLMRRGHPNSEEAKAAREWARKILANQS